MSTNETLLVTVNGTPMAVADAKAARIGEAVINSLFSWARARADDDLPASSRQGWWGDTYASAPGDRYGSRLWLLSRSSLTDRTLERAREYAREALQWLVDDGVAARVDVGAERAGIDTLALSCVIVRSDGTRVDVRFDFRPETLSAV